MEVKSVYMDLVEGKKKGNVWKLESEAFKKPIEIKICYDNHELAEFNKKYDGLHSAFQSIEKELDLWNTIQIWDSKELNGLKNQVELQEKVIQEQEKKISEQKSELKELYKVVADQKTRIETLSGTMLKLQETISEIQKKLTKQPTVIHDKCFVSWRESCGLWMINIPDGEYLLIAKYVVGEHNEYVSNTDEILFDKIRVEGQHYVPFYKLEWGTELDTPTATIYYDLVFMPL